MIHIFYSVHISEYGIVCYSYQASNLDAEVYNNEKLKQLSLVRGDLH